MTINFRSFNSIPTGGDIVDSWAIKWKAVLIRKEIINFEVVETEQPIIFKGMIQNDQGSRMDVKEIGTRDWKSYTLWCTYRFKNDDAIKIENKRFRVMATELWNTYYSFFQYQLTEDYTDNGTGTQNNL